MTLEDAFERFLRRVFSSSRLFTDRHLAVHAIVNPEAGGLSTPARLAAALGELDDLAPQRQGPRPPHSFSVEVSCTRYVGHAGEITAEILRRPRRGRLLVLSAGGDGTHSEVLSSGLADAERHDSGDTAAFMRLPLGTGNDGAEAHDLPAAATVLLGDAEVGRAESVRVQPRGMAPFRAFNIASIGLDAYVAYLTNKLKSRFGGDLYRLIADVMTLLYERVVGAGPVRLAVEDEKGRRETLEGRFMIVAFGASGHRRYGGGKRVLPGEENLCAIERLGLLGKIRLKRLFYDGLHVGEPNVAMRAARTLTMEYEGTVPMQLDGECVWLRTENFPVLFRREPPRLPVLAPLPGV